MLRAATLGAACGLTVAVALLLLAAPVSAARLRHCHQGEAAMCPDPAVTPGAHSNMTARELCSKSFRTGAVRHVTDATKRQICAEYGITGDCPDGRYEIDHLISLELGGLNDPRNLWPQPYAPIGAHQKDLVENWLHHQVCAGAISLDAAQHDIAADWLAVYRRMTAEQQKQAVRRR
jgi:hypothetical protein